jgi:membrane-bound ClpP family serine protease
MHANRGARAYLFREVAELAALIGIVFGVSRFVHIPLWVLVGIPLGKVLFSVAMYVLFLRRTFFRPPRVGVETLVGEIAETITPLAPSGQVKLNGEIWSATSHDGTTILERERVKILKVEGNTVHVVSLTHMGSSTATADF